jgi:phospholipid/cholesterol/gamma-HCH transport system substrate-binding protein
LRFGSRGFRFTVTYPNVAGLAEGSSVRLRGVAVGRVERIVPQAAQVEVQVAIDQPLIIPRDALFITQQTGLVGETVVDILPRGSVEGAVGSPLAADCDRSQIICDGDVVEGKPGVDFGQLLIRLERLLARVDDDEVFSTLNATLEGITRVADSVANLSETLEERVAALRTEDLDLLQFTEAARAVSQTAASLQEAADQFTALLLENRASLRAALENIQQVSADLEAMSSAVRPLLTDPQLQEEVRQILVGARVTAENAAKATEDLRQLAAALSDPGTLATLRQTLDSARISFQNVQKITADIDELTGDPQFRRALRELVLGLSNLVSSAPSNNGIQPAAVQVAPVSFTLAPMGQQPVPQEEAKIPAEIRSPSSGKSH